MGETTLTEEQMPTHTHDFTVVSDTGADIAHGNSIDRHKRATSATGGSQSHAHDFTSSTDSANSLPPYYVLSLIVKIS